MIPDMPHGRHSEFDLASAAAMNEMCISISAF
jgi:hypothetical protein